MKMQSFSDENDTRKANILQFTSTYMLLGSILATIISLDDIKLVLTFSVMILGALLSLIILHYGHIRLSSWTMLLSLLISTIIVLLIAEGVHDILMLLFPISIMAAIMMLDKYDFIVYSVIIFLSIQILFIFELLKITINPMSQYTTINDIISVGLLMFISILLAYKIGEAIRNSFTKINLSHHSLEESNSKIQNEMEERENMEIMLNIKVKDLEKSELAALNIMEDLNDTVQTLKRVKKELEFKNKELEDYTYTVSHDLKAPLVTIQGFSELLERQYGEQLDDKAKHYIDRINQGSENLAKLVSDLLELSRAGRQTKEFEYHDFN